MFIFFINVPSKRFLKQYFCKIDMVGISYFLNKYHFSQYFSLHNRYYHNQTYDNSINSVGNIIYNRNLYYCVMIIVNFSQSKFF